MDFAPIAAGVAVIALAVYLVLRRRRAEGAAGSPLERGLEATRRALGTRLVGALRRSGVDWDEITEALIAADIGQLHAEAISASARSARPRNPHELRSALESALLDRFAGGERTLRITGDPAVVLVVGVNGSGKTTTLAKVAALLAEEGHTCLLGAADTFRAAAVAQLKTWGERLGVEVVAGQEGADSAAVAFDAVSAGKARGADVVLIDTAGRLHSKQNLMDELAKVLRVVEKAGGAVGEVLLVIDGTTGRNAVAQAQSFREAVGVTGIAVTKLDGTARGGVVVAVEGDLGIPVKLVGVGEAPSDLLHFDPQEFVSSLLGGS